MHVPKSASRQEASKTFISTEDKEKDEKGQGTYVVDEKNLYRALTV